MERTKCRTQAELETALKAGDWPVCVGDGYFVLNGGEAAELWENSHAVLWGNSRAELWENSHAELRENSRAVLRENSRAVLRENSHAELRENSHAKLWENSHAVLRGNSHAELRGNSHAELWENSHAELWENSHAVLRENSRADAADAAQLHARDNCTIRATKWVAITRLGDKSTIDGGTLIQLPEIKTPSEWCEYYGVEVKTHKRKKYAILFKGVRDDYHSARGFLYMPGTIPEAPDWDGGARECGGGLHFSPRPAMTLEFDFKAARFLACPVSLSDMAVHPNGGYPQKCKAKGLCLPCWEVDQQGNAVAENISQGGDYEKAIQPDETGTGDA
jgi:hypothetical protein